MNASSVADQTAFRCDLGAGPRGTRRETVPSRTARPISTEGIGPSEREWARVGVDQPGSGPAIGQLRVVPSGETNDPSD
jgi:hypothetical protein